MAAPLSAPVRDMSADFYEVNTHFHGGTVENHFRKITLSTPDLDSNLDLSVICSLIYCKSSALDHVATEAVTTANSTIPLWPYRLYQVREWCICLCWFAWGAACVAYPTGVYSANLHRLVAPPFCQPQVHYVEVLVSVQTRTERRKFWELKEEAEDRVHWRSKFTDRRNEPVVRQNT
uniref:Uncharacterized protein n=1 Tax=Timema bartmani TaxID=61472 RepID=A0A7R9ENH6_9NEOP|nr:unnamed protein product [Timema bartmani]